MQPKNIDWNWRNAAFGVAISSVAALSISTDHVQAGLILLIGAIPAAVLGLPPLRAQRRQILIVGLIFGIAIMLGSVLAQSTIVATICMFVLGVGAATLAAKKKIGAIILTLCYPLVGMGLTYKGLDNSAGVGILFIAGSVTAYAAAMCFPEFEAPNKPVTPLMNPAVAREYGIRLGLAAAVATALSLHFGAEHAGWIVGSTLMVMRPAKDMLGLRGAGRAISVLIGAFIAAWLLTINLPLLAIAAVSAGAIIAMSATNASRWYITPAFTTFLILWAILYSNATYEHIEYRFYERVLGTFLGVAIAYLFGFVVPKFTSLRRTA